MANAVRPGLPPLPPRIAGLPVDRRGFPIPFFVAVIDGEPDHRVMDPRTFYACVNKKVCWVCGHPLGKYLVFTVGPMCAINRISGEPPSHRECALFSVQACPFLSRPHAHRRDAGLPDTELNINDAMLPHNPGVTLLWTTTRYTTTPTTKTNQDGKKGVSYVIVMGPAERMEWFAQGREATRAEIDAAIERGVPALRAAANGDEDNREIDRLIEELRGKLPT